MASSRTASMTRAGSQPLGQRALQVSQVRQSQMDSSWRARSREPYMTRRITWWGRRSDSEAMGHPAEHLPHW